MHALYRVIQSSRTVLKEIVGEFRLGKNVSHFVHIRHRFRVTTL
jgi:hypothetical protein